MCTYRFNVVDEPQASVVKASRVQVHAQHAQLVALVTNGRQQPLRHTEFFLENSPRRHQVISITVVHGIKPFQIRLQGQYGASLLMSHTRQSGQLHTVSNAHAASAGVAYIASTGPLSRSSCTELRPIHSVPAPHLVDGRSRELFS